MTTKNLFRFGLAGALLIGAGAVSLQLRSDPIFVAGTPPPIAQTPLYLRDAVPPLNMLVMGKDHKIYYEAYNDASDLDGDGSLDVGYKGWERKPVAPIDGSSIFKIDYYGYFNSYACYRWDTTKGGRFVATRAAPEKTCGRRNGEWSGDFLNYLTTSRMDALRRVLYGGWRQVDTEAETILQGSFVPQDGHSWGKEYQSVARDGYHIADYAPMGLPVNGRYHLFAVTTTTGIANSFLFPNYQAPMFRILRDSPYRVWNWLSIESPVAGTRCFNAANQRVMCTSNGTAPNHPGHPGSRTAFDTMVANFATDSNLYGSGPLSLIDCSSNNCNPYAASQDNFLAIIEGQIRITNTGFLQFRVDGDDVIDFELRRGNGANAIATAGCYNTNGRGFGACGGAEKTPVFQPGSGTYFFTFRQEEAAGGEGYRLEFRTCSNSNESSCGAFQIVPTSTGGNVGGLFNTTLTTYNLTPRTGATTLQDMLVRVEACPSTAALRDTTCKVYPNGTVKPTGILHDYGESQRMYFGLITGSQRNNLEGGVLRRNVENFASEIDPNNGVFRTNVEGIARSIDRLRMIGGGYNNGVTDNITSDAGWNWGAGNGNCPSIGDRPINNGECRMWGNPIAEMLYESLRYFAGAAAPTARFATTGGSLAGNEDQVLGLPAPAWRDPYSSSDTTGLNYPSCARPYQTIISDINPSYDGDLPGSAFPGAITTTSTTPATISGFHAANEGQAIWNAEFGAGARNVFIGESATSTDGNPTVKSVSSFGNIRGLSPEEPGKMGTYYAASVARFGRRTDVNSALGDQYISTYSIALASPLPRIEFPLGTGTVTLVPFAKTVSGTFGGGTRKPTNTIVDFYVEEFANFPGQAIDTTVNSGRPRAVFRINYEDVEQGNDHDMDAIARYEIVANSGNSMTVNITSEYAAGSANQNMGYIISGTTRDGVYLEVRDRDNNDKPSSAYSLNTPPNRWAGECVSQMNSAPCNQGLDLESTRSFTASANAPAIQLRDPLWYAAKYGAPDPAMWDSSAPGTPGYGDPDNYFLVTNPLTLRNQLSKAFDDMENNDVEVGNRTLNGARVGAESFTLQPSFRRDRNGKDWSGNLVALALNRDGTTGATLWNARSKLPAPAARKIFTMRSVGDGTSSTGARVEFLDTNLATTGSQADRLAAIGVTQADLDNRHYGAYTQYTAADFVSYIRGDRSREASTPGNANTLRERSVGVIGSIVNSEPVISSPRADYGHGLYSDPMFSGYVASGTDPGYLSRKSGRDTMIYVGANDGMLHAFQGNAGACADNPRQVCAPESSGVERFAFIPNSALRQIGVQAKTDEFYTHRYYVDGQISVGDIKVGTGGSADWRTILVGSAGGGGRSVFALNVTNPTADNVANPATSNPNFSVLWERNDLVDSDIGSVYGKPLIVPLENGQWGVLFGNGYGGSRSDPSLYVLNAATGALIKKITADDGNLAVTTGSLPIIGGIIDSVICSASQLLLPGNQGSRCAAKTAPLNGLGQITAIDRSGNGKVDTVYGGDLQGNLWKFDLSNIDADRWGVANGGTALFTAERGGERQPITGGIRVAAGPGTGVMVYFGTGRYLFDRGTQAGDNEVASNPAVQSLYAIFDNGTAVPGGANGRSNLQAQTVSAASDTAVVRTISRARVSYLGTGSKRGWYIDLQAYVTPSNGPAGFKAAGERFIATPRIQSGRVFFTTFTPSEDSCKPGGDNFVYGLDLLSGSGALTDVRVLPSEAAACTGADCGAVSVEGGGAPITSTSIAAFSNPTPVTPSGGGCDPTTGECPTFEECQVVIYPGAFVLPRPCGRQSWRQIR
ncbi:hypothetical protein AO715_14490 [Xanthomonas sp. Mitacek01]|nr:hypothetical protein AO715_14490 [Xanthomonas sp. Mitacek01]